MGTAEGNRKRRKLRIHLEESGYYVLMCGRKNKAYLHRFLYALSTGKDIRGRIVHHLNGRLDNRPDSLIDLSPKEHQHAHNVMGDRPMTAAEQRVRHRERIYAYTRQWAARKRAALAQRP